MISSGKKRGLAAIAVSALAVTGVPFLATSASAVPLASSVANANDVEIATPDSGAVSNKADGTDSTVNLEAVGGNNVSSVKFEYSLNGTTWTTIGTAQRGDNGAFQYEWNPAGLDGATVDIRATGLAADGTTTTDTDTAAAVDVDNTLATVNIPAGTAVGVFQKPDYDGAGADTAANNVIVSGTSSSTTATPGTSFWDDDTDTGTAGNQPGWAGSGTTASTTAQGATTGTWSGVLDITGYNFGTGDEILLGAFDATDDAEAFNLYKQTITTVTATADRTQVPTGQTANVTIVVTDQNGNPIAGAEVRNSAGSLIGQTNGTGRVTTTQGPGTQTYYANATDSDAYEPELGDKQSSAITVTQYAPAPTTLAGGSVDGAAFDLDEYAAGDISVQIKDQNGNNITESGRTVRYYWTVTPFDGSPASERIPAGTATSTAVTVNGKATIPLPAATDPNGTYVLNAALDADGLGNGAVAASNVLTFKAGDSNIKFDQASPEQALAGTSEVVSGKLVLADGTGLAGRNVQVAYANGTNAGIVQANGTTGPNRTVVTGADGSFSVTVKDPAETPQPVEDGDVTATTQPGTSDNDNPQESAATVVDFVASVTPGIVTITDQGGADTPGELNEFDIKVTTGDLDPNTAGNQVDELSNATVTLTLDHGYFTDGTPAATPVVGADAGDYKKLGTNNGQSLTVQTDANGNVTVLTSIGRDAGFDDDGEVVATLTATAGAATDTEADEWDSSNPLNGGEVELVEAPEDRQDGPTDPSPLSNDVAYDIFVTDQFGNLVGGEQVDLEIDDPDAGWYGSDESDFDARGDFWVEADRAGTYTVTAEWDTDAYRYTTTTGNGAPAFTTETVEGEVDVEFYAVDFAASTFTIETDPEGVHAVGTAVTEIVTVVDQEGNPVQGLDVEFIRQGPGPQTGDPNVERVTNANGQAFYSFTGEQAGVARISAVITDGEQIETLTDEVSFEAPGKVGLAMKVTGSSQGQKDVIKVNANENGAGLTAILFKNGKQVKSHALDGSGDWTFKVNDKNGNKKTTYKVLVKGTAATKKAEKVINVK